ncbi:MAG: hypothetical protein ACI4MQ_07910 [Candidatus Coproplasma sp.]
MKNILHRIGKDIWAYIVCIFVVIMLWSWIFNIITKVKTEEKVSVFIATYTNKFEKYEELNDTRPEYLRTVELNACSINDGIFSSYLSVYGYEIGDILILPESYLSKDNCAYYYAEISATYQAAFENLGYYTTENGKVYGIKIHDKDTHESVIDCISYGDEDKEQNYYLLFNRKSVHLSDLSDESKKSEMNGAIEIAKRLLEL